MSKRLTKGEGFEYEIENLAGAYELEPNPIPGPKWQANFGVMRLPYLCGASKDVLHCLVELAHEHWGFAFPSKKYLQRWTGRSRYAVDRALAKLRRLGLTRPIERRIDYDHSQSTLEVINWFPLFFAYKRVERLRKRDAKVTATRRQRDTVRENAQYVREIAQTMCENAVHSYSYLSESKGSESTPPSGGVYPFGNQKRKEGFQERGDGPENQPPVSQQAERPEGFAGVCKLPPGWWRERSAEAEADLARATDPATRRRLEERVMRCRENAKEDAA